MNDHTVAVQEANRNQAKGNEPTETRATTVCAATTGSTRNAGKKDAKGLVPNQPVSSVQRCVMAAIIRSRHCAIRETGRRSDGDAEEHRGRRAAKHVDNRTEMLSLLESINTPLHSSTPVHNLGKGETQKGVLGKKLNPGLSTI